MNKCYAAVCKEYYDSKKFDANYEYYKFIKNKERMAIKLFNLHRASEDIADNYAHYDYDFNF